MSVHMCVARYTKSGLRQRGIRERELNVLIGPDLGLGPDESNYESY